MLGAEEAFISGQRAKHLEQVLAIQPGARLKAGVLNGLIGEAEVLAEENSGYRLRFICNQPPPEPLPLILILALPRPKMLRRLLQMVAGLGAKSIYLLNSYRVEKSYWSSPWLQEQAIREQLMLGLMQARDTMLPTVELRSRFRPFIEDELPHLLAGRTGWVAHPGSRERVPVGWNAPSVLALGPEGGFIPFEMDLMAAQGMRAINMGPRILRVEWAVNSLVARMFTL